MKKLTEKKRAIQFFVAFLCFCLFVGILSVDSYAANSKMFIDGKIYEFDKDNDYNFSEATSSKSSADLTTYGKFSIYGNESALTSINKQNGVIAYSVEDGNITISYTYSDDLLNAANNEWHLIEDKEKNVDVYKLDNNIQKGALILQRSIDHLNWSNVSIQTNVFENTPKQNASLYETLDVELNNGCYYRLIVVYELSRLVESSKVLWVITDNDYEYKRVAEVYEFYAKVDNEHIEPINANTKKHQLGVTEKVDDFASYSGTEEITKDDIHYGWELGNFFVSGFTSAEESNGKTVFLKNVGDEVTLWFNLNQNINALNNDADLTITADGDGYDQYFQTETTNFGRGMLIIRYTDYENKKHDPVMYYNFLEANTSLGADTRVQLFEEGDYEVALDYEVTKDQLVDKTGHYRIFFKFSVRNANCMIYPFDVKTGAELTNSSVTPNGFKLDLAKSRYLKIFIEKEIWTEGADGLTKDTRFNTTAKDGDEYTDEGIYTITVENQYTGLKTTKTIYVGTNKILMAYMTSNYSLSEILNLVYKGATIYEDGTIEMPPETYAVTYEFISGTPGEELPDTVLCLLPLNQANTEDGMEVEADEISETNVFTEGGTWVFKGWDANRKVIDGADQKFIGTWYFEISQTDETEDLQNTEDENKVDSESLSGDSPVTETIPLNEPSEDDSGLANATNANESAESDADSNSGSTSFKTLVVIVLPIAAICAVLAVLRIKKNKMEDR